MLYDCPDWPSIPTAAAVGTVILITLGVPVLTERPVGLEFDWGGRQ